MGKVKLDKRLLEKFKSYNDLELKELLECNITQLVRYQKAFKIACEIIKKHGVTGYFSEDKWYEIYKLKQVAMLRNIKIDINLEDIICSKEDVIEVLNDFASEERLDVDENGIYIEPDAEIDAITVKYSKIIRWVQENDIISLSKDNKNILKRRLK